MQWDRIAGAWDMFLWGAWYSAHLTALAVAIGFVIALPCSLILLRGGLLRPAVRFYVYIFRGSPLLVQLFLIYYGLGQFEWLKDTWFWTPPEFLKGVKFQYPVPSVSGEYFIDWKTAHARHFWPSFRSEWWCALLVFSLNSGAYMAEILRGALATTPKGELEGAKALGLTPFQVTRLILIPSSLRRALPQMGNEVVFMLHGSAIVSVITVQDILGAGRTLNNQINGAYEGLLTAAFLYMAITFAIIGIFRKVERRYLRHLDPGGSAAKAGTEGPPIPEIATIGTMR